MAVTILDHLSPRLVVVPDTDTSISAQELVDELRDWEDRPTSTDDDFIISAAGKEDLGGGQLVGITATLQNAQIHFQGRTTPRLTAEPVTTASANGTVCICAAATFVTDGVTRGDIVLNETTFGMATVLSVDSETQLTSLPLSGGSRNDWQVSDTVRVYNNQQCDVEGGNVVAVDENGGEISAILPSAFVQAVRTSSSSATLQELQDLQFASFNGGVSVDIVDGVTGTTFPAGTEREPVDNFVDALAIASVRGFNKFYVIGAATIDSGLTYDNKEFIGQGQNLSTFTVTAAASVISCAFKRAKVTGTLDGDSHIQQCIIENLDFISGIIEDCILNPGTITLGGSEIAHFVGCQSGVPGVSTPVIDMGGSGQGLALRGYSGGIKLINHSGTDDISIDLDSGQVRIDLATMTNGTIVVRGNGKVVNDANGDHLPSGTYGGLTLINETTWGLMLTELWQMFGLDPDNPMTVTPTTRTTGAISQTISGDGQTTSTVTRT